MRSKISFIIGCASWGILILMFCLSVLFAIAGIQSTNAMNTAIGCPVCLCGLASLVGLGLAGSTFFSPGPKDKPVWGWWAVGLNSTYILAVAGLWILGTLMGS